MLKATEAQRILSEVNYAEVLWLTTRNVAYAFNLPRYAEEIVVERARAAQRRDAAALNDLALAQCILDRFAAVPKVREFLDGKRAFDKMNARLAAVARPRKDCHAILGVPKNATAQEIKSAYRKLARRWHPDANRGTEKAAQEKFVEISYAYQMLLAGVN